jgi:hypothetical protein
MQKKLYWVTTSLLSLIYLAGGIMYLSMMPEVKQAWTALGYPTYLVPILAVVKLLAAILVLWRVSPAITDLVYAGMLYHLLLAFSAHINAGDGGFVPALVGLICLAISFATQNGARAKKSSYATLSAWRG